MGKHKDAEQMAEIIGEIYEKKFGGKSRGRFQIPMSSFRHLSGRKRLHESFIYEVAEEALEEGYVLVPLGDSIAVVEEKVMLNYRNVPKSIINNFFSEEDDESENSGEDEDDE